MELTAKEKDLILSSIDQIQMNIELTLERLTKMEQDQDDQVNVSGLCAQLTQIGSIRTKLCQH